MNTINILEATIASLVCSAIIGSGILAFKHQKEYRIVCSYLFLPLCLVMVFGLNLYWIFTLISDIELKYIAYLNEGCVNFSGLSDWEPVLNIKDKSVRILMWFGIPTLLFLFYAGTLIDLPDWVKRKKQKHWPFDDQK